eukprot:81370_1
MKRKLKHDRFMDKRIFNKLTPEDIQMYLRKENYEKRFTKINEIKTVSQLTKEIQNYTVQLCAHKNKLILLNDKELVNSISSSIEYMNNLAYEWEITNNANIDSNQRNLMLGFHQNTINQISTLWMNSNNLKMQRIHTFGYELYGFVFQEYLLGQQKTKLLRWEKIIFKTKKHQMDLDMWKIQKLEHTQSKIASLHKFLTDECYDTDSVIQDISDSGSNIKKQWDNGVFFEKLEEYIGNRYINVMSKFKEGLILLDDEVFEIKQKEYKIRGREEKKKWLYAQELDRKYNQYRKELQKLQHAFESGFTDIMKKYLVVKAENKWFEESIQILIDKLYDEQKDKIHQMISNNCSSIDIINVINTLLMTLYKSTYYDMIGKRCKNYPSLKKIISTGNPETGKNLWSEITMKKSMTEPDKITVENVGNVIKEKLNILQTVLQKVFDINAVELTVHNRKIFEQHMNQRFLRFSVAILERAVAENVTNYVLYQNRQRCDQLMEKAKIKSDMKSVKRMKAKLYYGKNKDHEIMVNDPITMDHIISLICYTDNSKLCTTFRETYRTKNPTEALEDMKTRHSYFANMGRLLYEAFVFYASKENKIEVLYHGMSVKLTFPTLFCAFDAPTSTTSDAAVAANFCQHGGVILQFQSSESSTYIRTLDMSLFSAYGTEREHLIFETRLHIANIAVPSDGGWIGQKFMQMLSLYDKITHGSIIHDGRLLTTRNQKRLCNLLQKVMNNDLSKYPLYLKTLILSITCGNKKIWLNSREIDRLEDDLKRMLVMENNQFGLFMIYLKDTMGVVICPIFRTKWKFNDHTFDLISRTKKSQNVIIAGKDVNCKLSKNKEVIFRPQLTKIQDVFNVKMQLMNVYENLPIQVHFNVECKELDNYYTSSHP